MRVLARSAARRKHLGGEVTSSASVPNAMANSAERAVPESFAFVLNIWRLSGADSFMLAPGHELRRATAQEIAVIHESLGNYGPQPHWMFQHLWKREGPSSGGNVRLLPENEWRYYVISFAGNNNTLSELEGAFDLAP